MIREIWRLLSTCLMILVAIPVAAQEPPVEEPAQATVNGQEPGGMLMMRGQLGDYAATLDSSGTSWQPRSTPMEGIHFGSGEWTAMVHGFFTLAYGREGGPRGASGSLMSNMLMLHSGRSLGRGYLVFRVMSSLEPSMGPEGYPLLLQTGESADGVTPLIDRQHPHDLVAELSATYRIPVSDEEWVYFYVAPVGEPAIGPPTFMHRFSNGGNPHTPISHHMLDSSHITAGVLTVGIAHGETIKLEGSLFNGREPDERRWNLEALRFNSVSARLSVNPTPDLALQISVARFDEPEQIHPGVNVSRLTTSAIYNRQVGAGQWQTTLAFGRNVKDLPPLPATSTAFGASGTGLSRQSFGGVGPTTSHVIPVGGEIDPDFYIGPTPVQRGFLIESAYRRQDGHTFFGRLDITAKDELFDQEDVRHVERFTVSKLTAGYIWDAVQLDGARIGLGVSGSINFVPDSLVEEYGKTPTSLVGFLRIGIGR